MNLINKRANKIIYFIFILKIHTLQETLMQYADDDTLVEQNKYSEKKRKRKK